MDADDAAKALDNLSAHLDWVELTPAEVLAAVKRAKKLGVRGGRVHDLMHAVAADKSGADELLTVDRNDFIGLAKLPIAQV